MRYILLGIILALSPFTVKAEELPFPVLTGRVVDTANEIPDDQQTVLEKELADFEKNTRHQFVVVTIPDLKGNDVIEYTNKLSRHWGIGRAVVDDGIILLQSPGDGKPGSGKIRIEVGYGMEYVLTDVQTGRVIRNIMVPILKQNKSREETTPEAIIAGAREIMRLGAITPEQIVENERLKKAALTKRAATLKDFFISLVLLVLGMSVVGSIGFGGWLLATRKQRAERKAKKLRQEQDRKRRIKEQEECDVLAREQHTKILREQEERKRKAHTAMLAAMTPTQLTAYKAEQKRKHLLQLEAQAKRNEEVLAKKLRAKARGKAEKKRNRSSYSSNNSSSSCSSDRYSGGGSDYAGIQPTGFILVWALGQSNTSGRAIMLSSKTFQSGQAYKYVRSATNLQLLADPTGNDATAAAGRGSFGPALAKAVQRLSNGKIGVIIVNSAEGGTSLLTNWASGGEVWNQAKTDLTNALTDAATKKLPIVGACVYMLQGETDGDNAVTLANYKAAFIDLKSRIDTEIGAKVPFLLTRIGTISSGDTAGYATIRQAQTQLAEEQAGVFMGHTGTRYFAERGLMMDSFHYVISGYEEIGESIGNLVFDVALGQRPKGYLG